MSRSILVRDQKPKMNPLLILVPAHSHVAEATDSVRLALAHLRKISPNVQKDLRKALVILKGAERALKQQVTEIDKR